ncbi:hypothetical protein CROQUDRAFT_712918 [Cronartium quercuum f. sp. fusiforme G11]|uniref:Phosphatidylserine decarboxylase proenzyme 1, mitochondrial n=1 Tax=Cronartium quercuum f. sp. fusiforme G11 TaxID=708437 RepID=A0A9P6NXT6_9BASI|nr:hypothetical protein CROQUDRAFT_712918 [Cronartium quercuum f. sp. fusiforme G11]
MPHFNRLLTLPVGQQSQPHSSIARSTFNALHLQRSLSSGTPIHCLSKNQARAKRLSFGLQFPPFNRAFTFTPASQEEISYFVRLNRRLKSTKLNWSPIPIWVGGSLLVILTYLKRSEKLDQEKGESGVKIEGPWQVHVLGALPLRSISRLYGLLNSYTLPVWFRVPGYKLYSWIFGVNLEEAEVQDLREFKSLNEFFLRKLRPGCRPISSNSILVSPADGRIINFGTIEGRRVASVKGMSYSVDALLVGPKTSPAIGAKRSSEESAVADSNFANINDISYSVDQLMGSGSTQSESDVKDVSVKTDQPFKSTAKVVMDVAKGELNMTPRDGHRMFFLVVYLAPGDYHRFHSPADWMVQRRRHFSGELFSVSPWMLGKLADLFVLNERVALLGKWRHGFFSMTPVGATNVGSIMINFDRELRTNTPYRLGGFQEAIYDKGVLGGQVLNKGDEMGGFSLGSTIVLVFEAPERFRFEVKKGDLVKVGQGIGNVAE